MVIFAGAPGALYGGEGLLRLRVSTQNDVAVFLFIVTGRSGRTVRMYVNVISGISHHGSQQEKEFKHGFT